MPGVPPFALRCLPMPFSCFVGFAIAILTFRGSASAANYTPL